jgi:hypothetical protein
MEGKPCSLKENPIKEASDQALIFALLRSHSDQGGCDKGAIEGDLNNHSQPRSYRNVHSQ